MNGNAMVKLIAKNQPSSWWKPLLIIVDIGRTMKSVMYMTRKILCNMITDGSFICSLCGEWFTGCSLCITAPLKDMRDANRQRDEDTRNAERELAQQERAIRKGAEARRGEIW
jgi:hypothetical protein